MLPDAASHLDDLVAFLSAAPSPFHASATAAERLVASGSHPTDGVAEWDAFVARRGHLVRGGALIAWASGGGRPSRFRVIGAHTDSPNLRLRPLPDRVSAGMVQLGVEVYGSPLLSTWLDRDLGLSGRVSVRRNGAVSVELLKVDEPLLRIPNLAIHLDRTVNSDGLRIDPQQHLVPVWGSYPTTVPAFRRWLGGRLDVDEADVLAWDVMAHDLTPPAMLGVDRSMLSAPRIDNLLSCHAGLMAFLDAADHVAPDTVAVLVLFDHEEVGSETATGAAGSLLPSILERIVVALGGSRSDLMGALGGSICLSADCAHATHPNHPHRSEPDHRIRLDGGPVLKHNAMARYATDAIGAGLVTDLADRIGIPLQHFVSRGDLPCGSTIGPVTSARLGMTTVDIGVAQLSMHSSRELTGVVDPHRFARLCEAFFVDDSPVPS